MKRMQKIIIMLMMLCLAISMLPAQVFAAGSVEVTRAQWIQSLVETFAMTVEEDNYPDNYFSDLTGEEDYYRDILVAVEFGVIDLEAGMPFRPNDAATREFAAHSLNFALGFQMGEDSSYTFAEAAEVTYPNDIQIAVNRSWFSLSDGKFLPEKAVTAAEMDAMMTDAKALLADSEISDGYENVYSFTTEVVEIPDGTIAEYHETYVVIYDCPTKIQSGNVFAVYFNGLPCLYLAGDVTVDGNATTITVTELEENGYYENIDAQGVVDASFTEFKVLEGTEVIYIDEDTGTEYTDPAAAEFAMRSRGTVNLNRTLSVKRELTERGISGYMTVKMKNPKIVYDITDSMVSVKLVAKLETTYGISCNFIELQYFDPIPIIDWTAPGIGGLTVSLVLETEASVEGTTSGNLTVGVEYRGGNDFRLLKDFQKTAFTMVLKLSGKVGVEAKFGITDLPADVLEGYVFAEVGGAGEVEKRIYEDNQSCTHAAIYMYAEVGAKVSAKLLVFQKSYEDKLEIWNDSNSPIRIVHHYENGVLVPGCTRDSSSATNNGYYTPTSSPYWGSNWSGGNNSTGYDAKGNPVVLFSYTLDEDNNATITKYTGNANALVIPSTIEGYTVTAIGERAFAGQSELVTVDIPDTVTKIGAGAFAKCYFLESVMLPGNLITMGAHAFYNCDALVSIEIPKSLESTTSAYIAEYAYGYVDGPFYDCDSLRSITFEPETTVVASGLFANCPGIRNITIPKTVVTVERTAFYNCANLQSVSLPASLTVIEEKAFAECGSLQAVVIPDTVTTIGPGAFANCTALESAILPKNLTTMDAHAFYNCDALTSIEIPGKLESTDDAYFAEYAYGYVYGPFFGCDGLKNVCFQENAAVIANGLFANCSGLETIVIPDTITTVEADAFYNCEALREVTLSKTLTVIESKAFAECESLKNIAIPDSVTNIRAGAFANCTALESAVLSKNLITLDAHAFYNCDALTDMKIPKRLESTDDAYFAEYAYGYVYGPFYGCDGLKNVTFEEGSKKIANGLFANCTGLETILIPESITSIEHRAFHRSGLTEIVIPDTVTSAGDHILADCPNLKKITWTSGVSVIPEYTFSGSAKVEAVTIPDNITKFSKGVFRDSDSLATIKLPESLTSLSGESFYNCDSLREITIPDKVTTIDYSAFYNCDALETAVLGKAVEKIGSSVFYDCDALTTVTMANGVTSMGASVFESCDVLKDVTLSRNLISIPDAAFKQCAQLPEITIPYHVTSIGKNAFNSSPKLTKVTMPRKLESIGTGAFSYPDTTVIYGVPGTYAETWATENGYRFVAQETAATEISLNKEQMTLNKGASEKLILSVVPADSTDLISWKSSDPSVATVSDTGIVKAVGVGSATIKVTVGDLSAGCQVTVVQPVTSISLNKTSLNLQAMQTYQLSASVYPNNANNREISWTSSDTAVAAVDETGLVTAVARGSAVITAAAEDGSGVSRTCSVTVTNTGYIITDPDRMESSHNYPNNCTDFWTYTLKDAGELHVTFDEKTEMENGFDYLLIYDGSNTLVGKYTGTELAGQTVTVPGSTVKLQLQTDDGGSAWGFKVTGITQTTAGHVHAYGDWEQTAAPSCTEKGLKTRRCECGSVETEEIAATGHTWDKGVQTTAPTESTAGIMTYTCTVCGETRTETIPSPGDHVHNHVPTVTAPSCTEAGYTTYTCSCGDSYQADKVAALGHSYDDNVDGTCNRCSVNRETVETRQVTHMFRMYNPNTGEHFYTGSEEEKSNLVAVGWQYEGVGFTFPANTGAPVHRLFEPATGEHLYTMDEAEKASLMENGWNYEGIAFNSAYDTEAVQHRLHNPNATVGAYHFTFSLEEKQNLIDVGWEYQGIGWYSCWK